MNDASLCLEKLSRFSDSQFSTLLFRFDMPMEHMPPGTLSERAIVLIRYAEQQERLDDLWREIHVFLPQPAQASAPLASNPFGDIGRISDPARYFEREALLHEIFDALRKGVNLSLLGDSQCGKSTLLESIRHAGPQRLGRAAERFVYLNLQGVGNDADFFAALSEETGLPDGLSLFQIGRELRKRTAGRPFVLCLDEIECLSAGEFSRVARDGLRSLADGADMPLTLVIASRTPLDKLFPDNPGHSSPLAGICQSIKLPPFSEAETYQFLESRLQGSGMFFSTAEIQAIYRDSGGNPRRIQVLAAERYKQKCSV